MSEEVESLKARLRALREEVADTHAQVEGLEREHSLLSRFADAAASMSFTSKGSASVMVQFVGTIFCCVYLGNALRDGELISGLAMGLCVGLLLIVQVAAPGSVDENRVKGLEASFREAADAPMVRVDVETGEGLEELEELDKSKRTREEGAS